MDSKARQVATEVVEAGLEALEEVDAPAWDQLNLAFLELGEHLSSAYVGTFARGLESAQEDSPEAASLREKVAVDLHRKAVAIVTVGARIATIALQQKGISEPDARAAASWQLRSGVAEETPPGESEEELMATAHRNYVMAAAGLFRLNTKSATPDEVETFAHEVLDDVVSFAVSAAAQARAVESPAA